eukprot:1040059-Pelagomonas_calceolata.AAC.17
MNCGRKASVVMPACWPVAGRTSNLLACADEKAHMQTKKKHMFFTFKRCSGHGQQLLFFKSSLPCRL